MVCKTRISYSKSLIVILTTILTTSEETKGVTEKSVTPLEFCIISL